MQRNRVCFECRAQVYILNQPRLYALPVRGTTRRVLAGRHEKHIFASAERGRAQAFPLSAFLGANYPIWTEKLSYMTVKIISKPVKICSFIIFTKCFKVKISLIFADFFTEQILLFLIIPKSLRRAALTIANAKWIFCAGGGTALTSFVFHLALSLDKIGFGSA